ncbi:UNVERIFIED_CONTAM: hypothetical protein K2H54_073832 [Gekko kuhli]
MEKMSWLSKLNPRVAGHRAGRGASLQSPVTADPETCLIVFKNHWAQVLQILEQRGPRVAQGVADDLSAVRNNTYQMLTLLAEERPPRGGGAGAAGPILEFVASEGVLERLLGWHLQPPPPREVPEERKVELLKLFEMLISQSHQPLLQHPPVRGPLLRLLGHCAGPASPRLESSLVLLLHQLCVSVAREPPLLELFFRSPSEQGPANLLVFSLLVPFVHHEGAVGQQARDALLLLMAMSAGSCTVARYITDNSYFCPVLATGLSALYSSLPRKLEVRGDDWHFLRREDWIGVPSLVLFMNSLEFCNAVIQVAHPLVQKQLVDYIHNGFLVPVMGPALHKTSIEEMIASTAYLDLFLRSVTETALLKTFLRFLLLHRHDSSTILDTLVGRIASNSRLCMVSLSLFRTLLSLHCEDVLLQVVLRYLIPCSHVMLSQKRAVKELDLYGKAAGKFLSLIPHCCRPGEPASPGPRGGARRLVQGPRQPQRGLLLRRDRPEALHAFPDLFLHAPGQLQRRGLWPRPPFPRDPPRGAPPTAPAAGRRSRSWTGTTWSTCGTPASTSTAASGPAGPGPPLTTGRCPAPAAWPRPRTPPCPSTATTLATLPSTRGGIPATRPPLPGLRSGACPRRRPARRGPLRVPSPAPPPLPAPRSPAASPSSTGSTQTLASRRSAGAPRGPWWRTGSGPAPQPEPAWEQPPPPPPCPDSLLDDLLLAPPPLENGGASSSSSLTLEKFTAELSQLEEEMNGGGGRGEEKSTLGPPEPRPPLWRGGGGGGGGLPELRLPPGGHRAASGSRPSGPDHQQPPTDPQPAPQPALHRAPGGSPLCQAGEHAAELPLRQLPAHRAGLPAGLLPAAPPALLPAQHQHGLPAQRQVPPPGPGLREEQDRALCGRPGGLPLPPLQSQEVPDRPRQAGLVGCPERRPVLTAIGNPGEEPEAVHRGADHAPHPEPHAGAPGGPAGPAAHVGGAGDARPGGGPALPRLGREAERGAAGEERRLLRRHLQRVPQGAGRHRPEPRRHRPLPAGAPRGVTGLGPADSPPPATGGRGAFNWNPPSSLPPPPGLALPGLH